MAANVTYIPPKAAKPEALRVAAYCRVRSDSSDQRHSYATQIKAYTEQIGAHADEHRTNNVVHGADYAAPDQQHGAPGGVPAPVKPDNRRHQNQ